MTSSFGLLSLVSLLVTGGFSGLPLGMPPVENDPIIAHVAHSDACVYVAWNGMAVPSADSPNHTEQLLADAEVRRFVTQLNERIQRSIRKNVGDSDDEQFLATELPKLLHAIATSPTAISVGKPTPLPPIAIVSRVGPRAAEIESLLMKLQTMATDDDAEVIEIDGVSIHNWPIIPAIPPVQWGIVDDCVIIGFGPDEIQKIIARKKAKQTPAWLTAIYDRLPVDRVANIVHVNTKAVLETAMPFLDSQPQTVQALTALGIDNIQSVTCMTGLDQTGCVARTWINTANQKTGLFQLTNVKPLQPADFNAIPADSRIAIATRFDPAKVFQTGLKIADDIAPGTAKQIQSDLSLAESDLGFSFEKDIFEAIGDRWQIYQSKSEGGSLFTGWTAVVSVRDAEKIRKTMTLFKGFFAAQSAQLRESTSSRRRRTVRLQSYDYNGQEIYFLNSIGEELPFAPAWSVTDDKLVISVFPQGVTAFLNRNQSFPRLTADPSFPPTHKDTISIVHYDTKEIAQALYPLAQTGANLFFGEIQREGIDIDISILPSLPAISRHLQPGRVSVRSVSDGIEIVNQRTLPAGLETFTMIPATAIFGIGRLPFRGF